MIAPAAKPPRPHPQPHRTVSMSLGAAFLSASAWVAGVADAVFAVRAIAATHVSAAASLLTWFDMSFPSAWPPLAPLAALPGRIARIAESRHDIDHANDPERPKAWRTRAPRE